MSVASIGFPVSDFFPEITQLLLTPPPSVPRTSRARVRTASIRPVLTDDSASVPDMIVGYPAG